MTAWEVIREIGNVLVVPACLLIGWAVKRLLNLNERLIVIETQLHIYESKKH